MYKNPQQKNWIGRASNPKLEIQYWYQAIQLVEDEKEIDTLKTDVALIGYACDEGVVRNLGRAGAKEGPNAIRERLAKLPIHFNALVADVGNVVCVNESMEACQQKLSAKITQLLEQNIFPIAIGGGHDIAYGHFMGIWNALKNTPKKKIGIINFDAHFDLRSIETQPNSGTPFNQILNERKEEVSYFAIGIQQQSNTKELFDIAQEKKVEYIMNYDCEASNFEVIKKQLSAFIAKNDYLYITIDMDGFSSAYAPGVSAPSTLGFTPQFAFKMLEYLMASKKVISCDIAELNPTYDRDGQTAKLAAQLVDKVVQLV